MSTTHYIGYPCFGDPAFDRIFEFPEDKLQHMVKTWNERVKPEDTVYVFGDLLHYEDDHLGNRFKWLIEILNGKINAFIYPDEITFINKHLTNFGGEFDISLNPISANDNIKLRKDKYTIEITPSNFSYRRCKLTGTISVNVNSDINDGFGPLSFENLIEIQESFKNEK